MKLVTAAQMRELERIAIEEYGVPSLILMENAANGFLEAMTKEYGMLFAKKVHVFCGKGNNGGDGFAIARLLKNQGAFVAITLLCEASTLSKDAKTNMEIAKRMQIPFVPAEYCVEADIIIDAIFGTGFHGETKGAEKDAIACINHSRAYVASVDIPSGVSADTGHTAKVAVYADLCITFSAAKPGHFLFPGKNHLKKLVKVDISIPQTVINDLASGYDVIDKSAFYKLPPRKANAHKGSFGKVLAYVGAKGMTGAAVLSANAILKSGAGMATAAVPEDIFDIVAAKLTAVMALPLPEESPADVLLDKLKSQDVLLMGCGIGTSESAKETVRRLLKETEKPTVLDADGLNAIADCPHLLTAAKGRFVLTPHIVEFSRISGLSVSEIKENPILAACNFAKEYGITLVLKDAVSIVATKDGRAYISTNTNSGMATAGSGDVLSGVIAGLLAQGADCEMAAVCGVYLHLAAGELARASKGEYGMTAEDILEHLPYAFLAETDIAKQIKE